MRFHVAGANPAENRFQTIPQRQRNKQIDANLTECFGSGVSKQSLRRAIPFAHATIRVEDDVSEGQPVDTQPI